MNHILSFGIDYYWRKNVIKHLSDERINEVLDIATGTADLAIMAAKKYPKLKIVGIDIAQQMIDIGKCKVEKNNLTNRITLQLSDAENIPYDDNKFDAAMVAFGVRNFEILSKGLSEIYRVLNYNGILIILEFSKPKYYGFSMIYSFYFNKILPFIGRLISKNNTAYKYLPESVMTFPDYDDFIRCLRNTGFVNCSYQPLTLGIATIYLAFKK